MSSCSAITKKGHPCKLRCLEGQSTCYIHKLIECKICNCDVSIKNFRILSCGHDGICNQCEKTWKNMGKHTCPFCREYVFIDSIDTCVTIITSLLGEIRQLTSRMEKIEVSDNIFKVLSTSKGKMLMSNYASFKSTVSNKIDELESSLINTPEYYYVDKWRSCLNSDM